MSDFTPVLSHPTGLLIEPLDVLMFRDARPFDSADTARSILPTPQTLTGMIRTYAMARLEIAPSELHTLRDKKEEFQSRQRFAAHLAFRGPWFCELTADQSRPRDLFVSMPATLVQRGKGERSKPAALDRMRPSGENLPGLWDSDGNPARGLMPLIAGPGEETPRAPEQAQWIGKAGLQKFLSGQIPAHEDLIPDDYLFEHEERTSLVVDPITFTSDPGLIFSARFVRLRRRIAFYAEFGIESHAPQDVQQESAQILKELIPDGGVILPFGGESRRVRVRRSSEVWKWPSAAPDDAKRFITLLITPAIFYQKNGNPNRPLWRPAEPAALRAAAIPRPQPVSGFGLDNNECLSRARGRPRPTRYAVPSGAVYFWERGNNANPDKSFANLLQLTENDKERAAGWGIALKGVWA